MDDISPLHDKHLPPRFLPCIFPSDRDHCCEAINPISPRLRLLSFSLPPLPVPLPHSVSPEFLPAIINAQREIKIDEYVSPSVVRVQNETFGSRSWIENRAFRFEYFHCVSWICLGSAFRGVYTRINDELLITSNYDMVPRRRSRTHFHEANERYIKRYLFLQANQVTR